MEDEPEGTIHGFGLGELRPIDPRLTRAAQRMGLDRACASCDFSAKEGKDRVCRFEPPRPFMFMVPMMQSPMPGLKPQQGFQITTHTAFPVVRDDAWCAKHEPRRQ